MTVTSRGPAMLTYLVSLFAAPAPGRCQCDRPRCPKCGLPK